MQVFGCSCMAPDDIIGCSGFHTREFCIELAPLSRVSGFQLHLHNVENFAPGDIQHFRALWPKNCMSVKAAFELCLFWGSEIGDRPCRLSGRR